MFIILLSVNQMYSFVIQLSYWGRGRRFIPCTTPKHDNFKPLVIMDSFNFIVSIHSYRCLIGKCEMLSQFLMIFNTDIEWIPVLKNETSPVVWNQVWMDCVIVDESLWTRVEEMKFSVLRLSINLKQVSIIMIVHQVCDSVYERNYERTFECCDKDECFQLCWVC